MARVALLIGTGTYAEGLSPLPAAPRDVEEISTVLRDPEMGRFEQVEQLIDESHTTIAARIETWFRERQKDDLALLYISGHGVKDDQLNLHFAAKDTRKHKGKLVTATAISASFVRDCIRESRAKRQVIILDCCFSGAIGDQLPKGYETINLEPLLRANDSEALRDAKGRVILTSSSSIQYSFGQREGSLSIYTHYLVEGIRTGAADTSGDGTISVQELHDYASRKVQEESPAMSPKIIVLEDEGYKIWIANAPSGDPTVKYRKTVEGIIQEDGETIDEVVSRPFLRILQAQLKLSDDMVQAIEAEVLEPIRERQRKEQRYREFFINVLEYTPSLGERERKRLRQFQQALGLLDQNVQPIEDKILAQMSTVLPPEPVVDDFKGDSEKPNSQEEAQPILLKPPLTGRPVHPTQQGSISTTTNRTRTPNPEQEPRYSLKTILFGVGALVVVSFGVFTLWKSIGGNGFDSLVRVQNLISAGDNEELYGSRSDSLELRSKITYRDELIEGIREFRGGNYGQSLKIFGDIRGSTNSDEASDPLKDPEILIFQNNSQARLNHQNQSGSPIYTIAAAVPLSNADGRDFSYGQQMLFGIAHAQMNAIKQGINLEVVIANDRNSPGEVEELAEELSKPSITGFDNQTREILAVIGHYSSSVTCSALSSYNEARLPVISPASVQTNLRSTCSGEEVFFRTVSSSAVEAKALVDYFFEESQIDDYQIALFYKEEEYSKQLSEEFDGLIKFSLGGRAQISRFDLSDESSVEEGISQLANFNVLAVFPDGRTSDSLAFGRAIAVIEKDGGDSLILGSNPLYDSPVTGSNLSDKLEVQPNNPGKGFVLATDWFPGCGSNKDFVREADGIWGGDPNRIYALAYEATQVLVDRLAREKTTRASILADLGNSEHKVPSYVFADKVISFDSYGDRDEIVDRILITPDGIGVGFQAVPGQRICEVNSD